MTTTITGGIQAEKSHQPLNAMAPTFGIWLEGTQFAGGGRVAIYLKARHRNGVGL